MVSTLFIAVLEVFFREIGARNQFKVPPKNIPAIFVCAPHANQFLDPFVVMGAVGRLDLCFLAAAKSMRLRLVGLFARLMESIPVERADDVAFQGTGKIWISRDDLVSVVGRGTRFMEQVKPGDSLKLASRNRPLNVMCVDSDERLTLKHPAISPDTEGVIGDSGDNVYESFLVVPRVDQSAMFEAAHRALSAGKAVGIFPEGGSHDRPSLLPFKAGVAIMALGTLEKHPEMPLRLVPVGLNYFSGHRFRALARIACGER